MHTKKCLAAAMISYIQNIRDDENISDYDFRIVAQENVLFYADDYLNTELQTCICKTDFEKEVSIVVAKGRWTDRQARIIVNARIAAGDYIIPDV